MRVLKGFDASILNIGLEVSRLATISSLGGLDEDDYQTLGDLIKDLQQVMAELEKLNKKQGY